MEWLIIIPVCLLGGWWLFSMLLALTGCQHSSTDDSTTRSSPQQLETKSTDTPTVSTMSNGINLSDERDAGYARIQKFAFAKGQTENAVDHLMEVLETAEISLTTDEDEGGEGSATIRKTENGFESQNGGHGWQSEWKTMTHDEVRDRILELAPHNMGGHWSTEGSITRRNAG